MKAKTEFKIEKNIPIPSGDNVFPCELMEVGDSFLIPTIKLRSLRTYLNGTLKRKSNDKKFKTKSVDGKNYRCWRIA